MAKGLVQKKGCSATGLRGGDGFTMVELLIVLAILSGVIAAVYSLYNVQYKVTNIEEDVAEVQQNLRVAMASISRDLRMAGVLVPGGTNPINAISNDTGENGSDTLTINTASADGVFARIDVAVTTTVSSSSNITFTVASAGEVALFDVGDIVRIINPVDKSQPVNFGFTVASKSSSTPSLTLTPSSNAGSTLFNRGFVIAKTGESVTDPYPNTVLYCLGPATGCGPSVTSCPAGQTCLLRIVNSNAADDSVVATNISNLQFRYILDGSTTEVDTTANLGLVRAARVSVTGQTARTSGLSGGVKIKEVTSVVRLRNR